MITERTARGSHVLRAARALDVERGTMVDNPVLRVEGDRIVEFGTGGRSAGGAGALDLGDVTLLPGLHDNHCHLLLRPEPFDDVIYKRTSARKALEGLVSAQTTLLAGFTTVRDPGDCDWRNGLVDLREFIRRGHAVGPRILVAPHYLSITGGHGDANEFACDLCMRGIGRIVDGVEAMRKAVREEIKLGADWIKVFASGGVLSIGDDPERAHYSVEELRMAAEEAHRLGRRITAHAHAPDAVRWCVEAGFDSVEHCTWIDDEGIRLMKERGVPCVPTLYVLDFLLDPGNPMRLPASILDKAKAARARQRERFARMVAGGVSIVYGTDIGVFPHGENWRDFPLMVAGGLSPVEAIRSATIHSARMNGLDGEVGTLRPGLEADIIAVAGDPVRDIERLADVRFVMKGGAVIRQEGRG